MGRMGIDRDWDRAVRDSLREANTPASDALWQSIESTLDKRAALTRSTRRGYIWSGVSAVAAAIIIALLLMPVAQEQIDSVAMQSRLEITVEEPQQETITVNEEIVDLVAVVKKPAHSIAKSESDAWEPLPVETTPQEQVSEPIEHKSASEQENEDCDSPSASYSHSLEQDGGRDKKSRRNTLSLLYAGGLSSGSSSALASRNSVVGCMLSSPYGTAEVQFDDIYNSSDISHHQPLGVGLKVQRELSDRLLITSGLTYTRLVSDIDVVGDGRVKQQIHFVGLPLQLNYRFFYRNNFSLYLGAGGGIEYCAGAKVGSQSMDERSWHYSADLSVGAEYRLNSWLGVYFEPTLSHYFTHTRLRSIRNDSPTTFNIRLGVSFSW